MSRHAKLYVSLVIGLGAAALATGLLHWELREPLRFAFYLGLAVLSGGLKVRLPGLTGTISASFFFVLMGIVELSLSESLLIGCSAILVQCLWKPRRVVRAEQVLFNVADISLAIVASWAIFSAPWLRALSIEFPLLLATAAVVYYLVQTVPIAFAIALTEGKRPRAVWSDCYFWLFPYYLAGAALVGVFSMLNRMVHWQTSILVLPLVYLVHRSYRSYVDRLEEQKKYADEQHRHAEEIAGLHLRTIEALALAIEAKDATTRDHLRRVQVYAVEVARELGLKGDELEAVRVASLLHDIGKLAVPEHIISKPGRLTPEEFEKMKIHPVVGAEILETVQFPYPVVPIVRGHHERWDGSGYPAGLRGEEIPIGARILAAVDCLDALASERQYRRALPLDEALAYVIGEAGKSFDPKVVEVLQRRSVELEHQARGTTIARTKLSTDLRVLRGRSPAAGLEHAGPEQAAFLASIGAARQEVQILFEMALDMGNSLSLERTLVVLAAQLKKVIPYDAIAVYLCHGDVVSAEYAAGDDAALFGSLDIPIGQGLSGWVAENKKPIVNGNPSVESGYLNDPARFSVMRSALAVPLEGATGVIGVLTLYRAVRDAFSADHLRVLHAVSSKLSLVIENSVKYHTAESSATTDYLTGLPNARSLFSRLEQDVVRCRQLGLPLTVMVCDLDGFKQINDRCGRTDADRLLKTVARALAGHCRQQDFVARIGGDEFVVVLPGFAASSAGVMVDRCRAAAANAGWTICGEPTLSLSTGLAHLPEDGLDAKQLLAAADRQMYAAKRGSKAVLGGMERVAVTVH